MPGHVSLETLAFEAQGGKTLVRTNAIFPSVADRDGMRPSGMEEGLHAGMERLDEPVARMTSAS